MATPAMQRYAAEIYRLQQDMDYVGLNELSESANASQQATARMVARMKELGYLAHELSDQFALGVNDKVEDRIDEITGRPKRCPHGEPIPSKDGVMPVVKDMNLLEVPSGSDCIISRVRTHDEEKLKYFAELGLVPGVPF